MRRCHWHLVRSARRTNRHFRQTTGVTTGCVAAVGTQRNRSLSEPGATGEMVWQDP